MKKISILIVALLASICANSQQGGFSKVIYNSEFPGIIGNAFTATRDNGYIIAADQGTVIKIDSLANIVWEKRFIKTISSSRTLDFTDIIPTRDSCFLLAGAFHIWSKDIGECYIVKINQEGEIIWSKSITGNEFLSVWSISQFQDADYIAVGTSYNKSEEGNNRYKSFVCMTDPHGDLKWFKIIQIENYATYIKNVKSYGNSVYLSGLYSANYNRSGFLAKLDSTGLIEWTRTYQDTITTDWGQVHDFIFNDKGILLYQNMGEKTFLIQTDFEGKVLWSKWYYAGYNWSESQLRHLIQTSDKGYAFTYGNENETGGIVATDSVGNLEFMIDLFIVPSEILETRDNKFLLFGNGPIYYAKSNPMTRQLTGLIKLDTSNINQICVERKYEYPAIIDTVSFKLLNVHVNSGGQSEAVTLSYDNTIEAFSKVGCIDASGSVDPMIANPLCKAYPNPSTGIITLELVEPQDGLLTIFNNSGSKLIELDICETFTQIDLSLYPSGIYFYTFRSDQNITSGGKIILSKDLN